MSKLETPAAEHPSTTKPARAAWWTLGVLTFVSILDWSDRALISAIAEPLWHEFELSDTELGFSMAFAYSTLSIFLYLAYSLGPIFTGFVSEQLEPTTGDHSLRYALVVASLSLQVWAAWHFYRAAATLKEDYARAAAF